MNTILEKTRKTMSSFKYKKLKIFLYAALPKGHATTNRLSLHVNLSRVIKKIEQKDVSGFCD